MNLSKVRIFKKYTFCYLTDDKYVGQRIALGKYEPYETELILRQAQDGDVVVDVGANIGYYTILLADKIGPNGKVYAFEPDSTNFEILKKNVEVNKLKNVILVNAAVGNKKGITYLYKSKENLGDHKLFKTPLSRQVGTSPLDEREKIKIIRLDDYLADIKIDLMKIDTQGWEPAVIDGAKKIIEKNKPIIFFEYSPSSYKMAKLDGQKMMNWLKKIYKKFWWIDEWLYIYKNLDRKKIDLICKTNKTGYADLWVKNKLSLTNYFNQYRDFKLKKWVKKIIGISP